MIGAALLFCIGSFALCGVRATQASSQWREWATPRRDDILERSAGTVAEAHIGRAVAVLRVAGMNSSVARWKVTMPRRAVSHLKRALLGLFVLAALVVGYAVGHGPSAPRNPTITIRPFNVGGHPHRHGVGSASPPSRR